MNWKRYLQDKRVEILIFMVGMIIEAVFLAACQVGTELFLVVVLVPMAAGLFCLIYDYYRKNSFYRRLFQNLNRMDQKYLVLETLESPRFYDGELLKEALYEANKSMTEHVNESRRVMREFKDFIEMWVHQVKLPVASLLLLCHNHPDENNKKYTEQLRRIDRYTEQVLYYTRAEHSEKDYLIQKCSLAGIIHHMEAKSTGMGLYIAHNMCEKLGHQIEVESKEGEYTRINITFL